MAELTIIRKKVGDAFTVLVDHEDLERVVSTGPWHVSLNGGHPYVQRYWRELKTTQKLHRFLTGAGPGQVVDHINGDGLDNRRANLRLATHAENGRNRRLNVNSTSGLKGVSWHAGRGLWLARIRVDGKQTELGAYANPGDAYRAYLSSAQRMHGAFASDGSGELRIDESDAAGGICADAEALIRERAIADVCDLYGLSTPETLAKLSGATERKKAGSHE